MDQFAVPQLSELLRFSSNLGGREPHQRAGRVGSHCEGDPVSFPIEIRSKVKIATDQPNSAAAGRNDLQLRLARRVGRIGNKKRDLIPAGEKQNE